MRAPRSTEQPNALEAEILAEKLAAYVRIARKLEGLVAAAQAARRAVSDCPGIDRPEDVARFEVLRRQAEQYFWYLIVQREALGLRRHEGLRRHYPIPSPAHHGTSPRGSRDAEIERAAPTGPDSPAGPKGGAHRSKADSGAPRRAR